METRPLDTIPKDHCYAQIKEIKEAYNRLTVQRQKPGLSLTSKIEDVISCQRPLEVLAGNQEAREQLASQSVDKWCEGFQVAEKEEGDSEEEDSEKVEKSKLAKAADFKRIVFIFKGEIFNSFKKEYMIL